MKTSIIGGGALGLLWSARLAIAGFPVTLVTRTRAQASLINEAGIILRSLSGEERAVQVQACSAQTVTAGKTDWLFVMVKQMDLPEAVSLIPALAHPGTQVLFWQNGWGHGEVISGLSAIADTYLAVTTEGALRQEANRVVHTGDGETWVGPYPERRQTVPPLLRPFFQLSEKIAWDQGILVRIWEKLAVNCVINPLTALEEKRNGEMAHPRYEKVKQAIIEELVCVAKAEGIRLDPMALREKAERVIQFTARNQSSMLQDMKRGRKTEIDYINGVVVKLGAKWRFPTPINAELVQRIHAKEAQIGC
ncbi:ketopantoate reductase family protein [Laceyella putida]|uniref:2-dehydropantoate 2-reductase n=1 Tax=Laceyella putida TaxID=110101 RepID=A0ABW2RMJ6_9BACL